MKIFVPIVYAVIAYWFFGYLTRLSHDPFSTVAAALAAWISFSIVRAVAKSFKKFPTGPVAVVVSIHAKLVIALLVPILAALLACRALNYWLFAPYTVFGIFIGFFGVFFPVATQTLNFLFQPTQNSTSPQLLEEFQAQAGLLRGLTRGKY